MLDKLGSGFKEILENPSRNFEKTFTFYGEVLMNFEEVCQQVLNRHTKDFKINFNDSF